MVFFSFSHHMLPSMTKGEIVASMCLISVVIDVNISVLSLVSTVLIFCCLLVISEMLWMYLCK